MNYLGAATQARITEARLTPEYKMAFDATMKTAKRVAEMAVADATLLRRLGGWTRIIRGEFGTNLQWARGCVLASAWPGPHGQTLPISVVFDERQISIIREAAQVHGANVAAEKARTEGGSK